MNGKVWNTRVTRKIEENVYKTIIETVLKNVMCCMVRAYEGERNWEFTFRRNGFWRRLASSVKGRKICKL